MGKNKKKLQIFHLLIDFRYGDLTPITPLGRGLACLGGIYGITIVSMLVSVLVGRYQRVYNRKRFFNEEYSDKMIFSDSFTRLKDHDECLESPIDIGKAFTSTLEIDNEKEENDERSGKVRFIIGYVSDEDSEINQDKTDGNENVFITKVAQELLQLKSMNSQSKSEDNLHS